METFPKDPFKMVKVRIISSGERKMMGIIEGVRDEVSVMEIAG